MIREKERERMNIIVKVGLAEVTKGRSKRKRE
jgi:hypothetical protein